MTPTAAYNLARIFGGTLLLGSGLIVMALIMAMFR
jgi:hypothetical protein